MSKNKKIKTKVITGKIDPLQDENWIKEYFKEQEYKWGDFPELIIPSLENNLNKFFMNKPDIEIISIKQNTYEAAEIWDHNNVDDKMTVVDEAGTFGVVTIIYR